MLPRHDFINQELSREYYDFPDVIDDAYSATYNWLSNQESMRDFDNDGPPTDLNNAEDNNESRVNTAREFTFLLPAHTLKIYRALLDIENDAKATNYQVILDKPELLLVDVGCGGGSATIALISVLLNYQSFRSSRNLPINTIQIRIAAIDPNDFALEIFSTMIGECHERVKQKLINITFEVIPESFTQCMLYVLRTLETKTGFC